MLFTDCELTAPTQLTREPVSDEQAVEDGTLSRFNDELWLESRTFIGTDKNGRRDQYPDEKTRREQFQLVSNHTDNNSPALPHHG